MHPSLNIENVVTHRKQAKAVVAIYVHCAVCIFAWYIAQFACAKLIKI
jgi:hypothetical protein